MEPGEEGGFPGITRMADELKLCHMIYYLGMLTRLPITQGIFSKLFDLLEASCYQWDLQLAYHYRGMTFTTYSAQLQTPICESRT